MEKGRLTDMLNPSCVQLGLGNARSRSFLLQPFDRADRQRHGFIGEADRQAVICSNQAKSLLLRTDDALLA